MRLSRLETIILQLLQSVQTIAEEMKSLKDSTLARSETVQELQQLIQEPDNMAATEKQQQIIIQKINKLISTNCLTSIKRNLSISGRRNFSQGNHRW